jgi:hypothetical protein
MCCNLVCYAVSSVLKKPVAHLQSHFYPVDGGSKFLRMFITSTKLHIIITQKTILMVTRVGTQKFTRLKLNINSAGCCNINTQQLL